MNEREWVQQIAQCLRAGPFKSDGVLEIQTGLKLVYGYEITSYGPALDSKSSEFETDLAIVEKLEDGRWKPRVVVEAKIDSITTHDAITYSHKASIHKAVHPYLRYGVMLGNRQHFPLPGRLYRHGAQFDFMVSFVGFNATSKEMEAFCQVLRAEVEASHTLERILYESRKKDRDHYTIFHRRLEVK